MVARLGGLWPKPMATWEEERPAGDLLQATENLTELPKGKRTTTKVKKGNNVCEPHRNFFYEVVGGYDETADLATWNHLMC